MASDTVAVRQSKVTLTNWERLNNAPLTLTGASAIQWNDNMFVLASGTEILYQPKLKLWSMLPSYSSYPRKSANNVPLVNYKGQILTVKDSYIKVFDATTISWNTFSRPQGGIRDIAVSGDTLYATASYENDPTLHSLTEDEWKKQGTQTFGYSTKLLFTSEYIFEYFNTYKVHRIKIENKSEAESEDAPEEPPKEIALPPYQDYTLHVVKDTLFSFGGRDKDYQPTSDVLRYNPDTDTWESAGYMRNARYNVVVTTMQQGKTTEVYVLGGQLGRSSTRSMMPAKQTQTILPVDWKCSISIIEKCTLFD